MFKFFFFFKNKRKMVVEKYVSKKKKKVQKQYKTALQFFFKVHFLYLSFWPFYFFEMHSCLTVIIINLGCFLSLTNVDYKKPKFLRLGFRNPEKGHSWRIPSVSNHALRELRYNTSEVGECTKLLYMCN